MVDGRQFAASIGRSAQSRLRLLPSSIFFADNAAGSDQVLTASCLATYSGTGEGLLTVAVPLQVVHGDLP